MSELVLWDSGSASAIYREATFIETDIGISTGTICMILHWLRVDYRRWLTRITLGHECSDRRGWCGRISLVKSPIIHLDKSISAASILLIVGTEGIREDRGR